MGVVPPSRFSAGKGLRTTVNSDPTRDHSQHEAASPARCRGRRPRALATWLLAAGCAVATARGAWSYEAIRRDSPLGLRLAELARRTGQPLEPMLGAPLTRTPPPIMLDSAALARRRAAIMANSRARMDHAQTELPRILFAEPPTLDSMPPVQIPPAPVLPESITAGILSIVVGNLDGDVLPDVAGISTRTGELVVRRNLGDGLYGPPVRYPLAPGAFKLALADLDGDGDPDLAVPNFDDIDVLHGRFSVLLNLGDGTFGERFDGDLGGIPTDVHVARFGSDPRAALVFPYFHQSGVGFVRADADGTIEPTQDIEAAPWDIYNAFSTVGDLDGDRNTDILILYRHGDCAGPKCLKLAVFYGRSARTFEDPVNFQAYDPDLVREALELRMQDVDADGDPDLLVRIYGEHPAPSHIRNAGSRHLEAPSIRDIGRTPYALAASRFRPGDPQDLVYSDDAVVSLLRNRGDGTFAAEESVATGMLVAIADLNHDGLGDLIAARSDTIEVRIANATGGFLPPVLLTAARFLAAADFTGDRNPDLAVILPNDDIGVLPGDGSGGFEAPRDFGSNDLRFPLQAVDLDGDGLADLAYVQGWLALGADDSLYVRWNLGAGFSEPSVFDLGPPWLLDFTEPLFPMDLKAGDFNGDGLTDLAEVKGYWQYGIHGCVTMVTGEGNHSFGPPSPNLPAGEDPYLAAVRDLDGDGLDDIALDAVTTDYSGRFYVFGGRADGSLEEIPGPSGLMGGYAVEHWAISIATGDFDGDGRPDVAVGCGYAPYNGAAILVVPNISPPSQATASLASLVSADAEPDCVSLMWDVGGAASNVTVERRTLDSGWSALATVSADASGRITYEDRAVAPGARYGYRLRLTREGRVATTTEIWVDVPISFRFAIEPARPNPTSGPLTVGFTLPSAGRAELDLLDIAGRRVRSLALSAPVLGRQQVTLDSGTSLAPGLYFVRLTQGHARAETRVAVIR